MPLDARSLYRGSRSASSFLGEHTEQLLKTLWSSAGLSRANSSSFSFGFLGQCVYVILYFIDPFDFLAGTVQSCSLQGLKPRRGGDWSCGSGLWSEGGVRLVRARGMRESLGLHRGQSEDSLSGLHLRKPHLWSCLHPLSFRSRD